MLEEVYWDKGRKMMMGRLVRGVCTGLKWRLMGSGVEMGRKSQESWSWREIGKGGQRRRGGV